ncbi:MAG: response regulator receiver protein [Candidatus Dactylopiibacterium carminicum]|uniref:Response regulator receiver protein n=1 Tax=Candidatus Dactylopiibacterium carminicum TaxID=857335 RepID=A0A272EME4_9RHOO|nr:response regulator [Candidatus Dactylopiibacterium carminicum]KAF7597676.1 response regulator receiver protein [Candidatus Dactylopiibacterium carminicum]PAS91293.1 MAG: response regulator receiver protein [Candidatus Dactylopiibacterium carminicum]PAS93774.1 MAG: response regulator receiver protein [Candidatus Dactylopiibacterium carminicum]PAS95876.1 MAG: response regulator receiver protein [Candidatus Dactylopiibacterium carminicum]
MSASLLVLDDEPLNLEIIGEYLADSGFQLSFFEDPERAWAQLDSRPYDFDLVLMDRMMPKIDGLTLLRRIKADPRMKHLPVIMQTAAAGPEQVSEGLAAGAHYYLTKPFRSEALLIIVRAALHDRARWADVSQRMANHSRAVLLLREAEFQLRTLEEAEELAGLLALAAGDGEAVAMGLAELLINGIEHGNLGIDFLTKSRLKSEDRWLDEVHRRQALPENQHKQVCVKVWQEADAIVVRISDEGPGFEWEPYLTIAPERAFAPNGRGIAVSRQMAFNDLRYLGTGNTVEIRFTGGCDESR